MSGNGPPAFQPRPASRGRAFTRSLVRNLLWSGLVSGLAALGWIASPMLGALVLFAGSFAQMATSYRREWRLGWITAILPVLTTGAAWAVQWTVLRHAPHPGLLAIAGLVGLGAGALRGAAHRVFQREGRTYAQRTPWFLLLWAACFLVTQMCSMARAHGVATAGSIGGAFTTAMLAGVAVVLLRKAAREDTSTGLPPAAGAAAVALLSAGWLALAAGSVLAEPYDAWAVSGSDLPADFVERARPEGQGRTFAAPDGTLVQVSIVMQTSSTFQLDQGLRTTDAFGGLTKDRATGRTIRVRPGNRGVPLTLDGIEASPSALCYVQARLENGRRYWYGVGVNSGWPGALPNTWYKVVVVVWTDSGDIDDAWGRPLAVSVLRASLDRLSRGPYADFAGASVDSWFSATGRAPTKEEEAFLVAGILMALAGMGVNVTNATMQAVGAAVEAAVHEKLEAALVPVDDSIRARIADMADDRLPPDLRARLARLEEAARSGRIDHRKLEDLEAEWSRRLGAERAKIDADHAAFGRQGNRFGARLAAERAAEGRERELEDALLRLRDGISNMRGRTAADLDRLDGLLKEIGADGNVTPEEVRRMRDLARGIFAREGAANEASRAEWEAIAANAGRAEMAASAMAEVGKVSANLLEQRFLPTGGWVTGMVFGAAEGYDPSKSGLELAKSIGWSSTVGGVFNRLGTGVDHMNPGSVVWGASSEALLSAGEYVARTGSLDPEGIKGAAGWGAFGGALGGFAGKPRVREAASGAMDSLSDWLGGRKPPGLPTIHVRDGGPKVGWSPRVEPGIPKPIPQVPWKGPGDVPLIRVPAGAKPADMGEPIIGPRPPAGGVSPAPQPVAPPAPPAGLPTIPVRTDGPQVGWSPRVQPESLEPIPQPRVPSPGDVPVIRVPEGRSAADWAAPTRDVGMAPGGPRPAAEPPAPPLEDGRIDLGVAEGPGPRRIPEPVRHTQPGDVIPPVEGVNRDVGDGAFSPEQGARARAVEYIDDRDIPQLPTGAVDELPSATGSRIMRDLNTGIITIEYGSGMTDAAKRALRARVAARYGAENLQDLGDIDLYNGGA